MYIFKCENCGRFFGSRIPWQKWCRCEECQRDKRTRKQRKHKKYQATHTSTNWTSHKFGRCFKCGKIKQLNRFGMCLTCYDETCNDNLEGDLLYTDVAVADLDQVITMVHNQLATSFPAGGL